MADLQKWRPGSRVKILKPIRNPKAEMNLYESNILPSEKDKGMEIELTGRISEGNGVLAAKWV